MNHAHYRILELARVPTLTCALWLATVPCVLAASTDIASSPLFTSSSTLVKPNLMFILDDSGSMAYNYLPDDAKFDSTKYGPLSSQCNGVAYNPGIVYAPPTNSDGTSQAAGSTAFIASAGDPNSMRGTAFSLSSPTSQALPVSIGNTLTYTLSSSRGLGNGTFSVGDTVTVYSSTNSTSYIVSTVTSWDLSTRALVLSVTSSAGSSGSLSSPKVRVGQPNLPVYYRYTGSETPLSYTYTSAGVITSTTFYTQCSSTIGASPGSSVFTPVTVTLASSEAQNYANWFAYYSTRIAMAKASLSRVFSTLGSNYRVGYSTISNTDVTDGTDFLNIRDFDATQKATFFTDFFAATPSAYTPLRGALSKAGRYYAKKMSGQNIDPVQYSCQKNFTILSTDGYWNTNDETSTYGPLDLDGNSVGQRDALPVPRPRWDGASTTVVTNSKWNVVRTKVDSTVTITRQYSSALNTKVDTYTAASPQSNNVVTTYSLGPKSSIGPTGSFSSVTPNCTSSGSPAVFSCTVTVKLKNAYAAPQAFASGNSVKVGGISPSNYNGTFNIVASTPPLSTTVFAYTVTGLSSALPAATFGSATYEYTPSGTCKTSNEGLLTKTITQTDLYSKSSVTTTTAQQTDVTKTDTTTATYTTPHSQSITAVDGVETANTGDVAGTTPPPVTSTSTTSVSGPTSPMPNIVAPAVVTASAPPGYAPKVTVTTSCSSTRPTTSTETLPAVSSAQTIITNPSVSTTLANAIQSGPTTTPVSDNTVPGTKTTTTNTTTTGGVSNSLADVAEYYYDTDLRDESLNNCNGALGGSSSVCGVKTGNTPTDPIQNMTTFTIGLGVNGTLRYDKNYLTQSSGDYVSLVQGTKNWPIPANGKGAENIDDLWHAAVNGRGQYFTAGDPAALVDSLATALQSVQAKVGSASAAATSTLQPVNGDNDIFLAQFTSVKWSGDLQRYTIDPSTGVLSTTASWSAAAQLQSRDLSTNPRTVYYRSGGALKTFSYANLTTAEKAYFDNFCNKTGVDGGASPQQCPVIADKTIANSGSNLVDYLLGTAYRDYRTRESRLGDIINGAPVFVGKPNFPYTENNYGTFKSNNASRTAAVFAGANDGMLHAFDRTTGNELWAFIPTEVLPKLYQVADAGFANAHKYLVDGAPVVGDIYVSGAWKTILVGGLGGGGRSYYALDITDPAHPVALWEFSNANLGLTFGNPIITKRANGTWVVVFASGYNNNVGSGDGNGRLFVLDANTGVLATSIPTLTAAGAAVGSPTTPSGLAKINDWVDSDADNTAKRFYGGDLLGNLWRFDIDSRVQPYLTALPLASLKGSGGADQPITTKPSLGLVSYAGNDYPVVFVGTGEYLGAGDLSSTDGQTVYAIADRLASTGLGNVRTGGTLVTQTLTTTTNTSGDTIRTATKNPVNWSTKNGWMIDLPSSGERVNVDPLLALSVLSVVTSVPVSSACQSGGSSFLYRLDINSGSATITAPEAAAGTFIANVLAVGQALVQLTDGTTVTLITRSDGSISTQDDAPPPLSNSMRRTSWREVVN